MPKQVELKMSNYTRITDFTSKDSLPTGNPSKAVLGAELEAEFDAIATAVATKKDKTFRGCLVYKTADQTSIASGDAITFPATSYDTDSIVTSSSVLTVPSGVSKIRLSAHLPGFTAVIAIHKNGSGSALTPGGFRVAATTNASTVVSGVLPVSGGDTFTLKNTYGSGGSGVYGTTGGVAAWLCMEIIE